MVTWIIDEVAEVPDLKKPILIEGLPGIGNVGKVAVDFLIDELKATKFLEVRSHTFPHSVFVNEKNLVELPTIELYYKQMKDHDLIFLAGDVQPIDEVSCYEFSDKIINLMSAMKGVEIITLGGIGLQNVPKVPKVFCTGNSKAIIKKYKTGHKINDKLYGVVGPIVGVSGLLLGLSAKKKIKAIALLAETFGHPMYLGIKGSREILKILNAKLKLGINMKDLDSEIENIEKELHKRTEGLQNVSKRTALNKIKGKFVSDTDYIG